MYDHCNYINTADEVQCHLWPRGWNGQLQMASWCTDQVNKVIIGNKHWGKKQQWKILSLKVHYGRKIKTALHLTCNLFQPDGKICTVSLNILRMKVCKEHSLKNTLKLLFNYRGNYYYFIVRFYIARWLDLVIISQLVYSVQKS